MINIKTNGQCISTAASWRTASNSVDHAPVYGSTRAFHTRRQLAYSQQLRGPINMFEYPVTVTHRKHRLNYAH